MQVSSFASQPGNNVSLFCSYCGKKGTISGLLFSSRRARQHLTSSRKHVKSSDFSSETTPYVLSDDGPTGLVFHFKKSRKVRQTNVFPHQQSDGSVNTITVTESSVPGRNAVKENWTLQNHRRISYCLCTLQELVGNVARMFSTLRDSLHRHEVQWVYSICAVLRATNVSSLLVTSPRENKLSAVPHKDSAHQPFLAFLIRRPSG